jgi:antitoxin MazE
MQTTMISKWGNSLALRLPRNIAEGVRLVEGTTVDLAIEDGSIRVTPRRPKFRLADLLAEEPAQAQEPTSDEVDWGEPRGDEVW